MCVWAAPEASVAVERCRSSRGRRCRPREGRREGKKCELPAHTQIPPLVIRGRAKSGGPLPYLDENPRLRAKGLDLPARWVMPAVTCLCTSGQSGSLHRPKLGFAPPLVTSVTLYQPLSFIIPLSTLTSTTTTSINGGVGGTSPDASACELRSRL
ncbi:hypothetical protein BC629DRAFT_240869 [Irpex lacteus]|nr:hypothetical protein BC629DRAFT_240869 [Irpex lacteus]